MVIFKLNNNKIRQKNIITLVSCWYLVKSKFSHNKYVSWINNLLSIANNFNLVIYTDIDSYKYIKHLIRLANNSNIMVVFKPFNMFYTYKYKEYWISNHIKSNIELHKNIDWKLNMIWNEKNFFVKDAYSNNYFNTDLYAWCDIGYFRNNLDDLNTKFLYNWPNTIKLTKEPFIIPAIHYGCVQKDNNIFLSLSKKIKSHYELNKNEEPNSNYEEICFAGGFFLLRKELIEYYSKIYSDKLEYYFKNNYFIKDDQTIITDLIFTNPNLFYIHNENKKYNNWFMFQRLLV